MLKYFHFVFLGLHKTTENFVIVAVIVIVLEIVVVVAAVVIKEV